MRSVYARILGWSLVTLAVSIGLYSMLRRQIEIRLGIGDLFRHVQVLELEQAVQAWETGGAPAVTDFTARLNREMGWHHYVLDGHGRALATGSDYSALIARLNGQWGQPIPTPNGLLFGTRTPNSQYSIIVEAPFPLNPGTFLTFNGIILLTVALLCWPLALHIGSPLKKLAGAVERFGHGDLSARAQSTRRDEIGNLARSFNRMADRIETLLTAERKLLQDVSHELRSPLARLSFAAELVATEPDREKAVARIRKEVSRLATLVGALLQMARAEGDPASGQRKEFLLDELVKDLVDDCTVETNARGCRVIYACSRNVPLTGDRELARRAIENVLRNAIRYSPAGEPVNVQVEVDGGVAQIQVSDRGPGVPDDALTRVFQPFYRVDESRSASTGGVGLGLAIAMRAVILHNGTIEARNIHPGLLVTIRLPLS